MANVVRPDYIHYTHSYYRLELIRDILVSNYLFTTVPTQESKRFRI